MLTTNQLITKFSFVRNLQNFALLTTNQLITKFFFLSLSSLWGQLQLECYKNLMWQKFNVTKYDKNVFKQHSKILQRHRKSLYPVRSMSHYQSVDTEADRLAHEVHNPWWYLCWEQPKSNSHLAWRSIIMTVPTNIPPALRLRNSRNGAEGQNGAHPYNYCTPVERGPN